MTEYAGSCHCGAIGFVFSTDRTPSEWSVRACQCRFCRMRDALSTSDPAGSLRFHCDDPNQLQSYRFALRTADFLLCRSCGIYIGAVIDIDGRHFGIINTHALVEMPDDIADTGAISYDGEGVAGRVSRREERWTPVTNFPGSG